jgi:predicted acylesterase/phospholipase RssA
VEPSGDAVELRLAVVMSGGVSLCIWMGGAALELDYLRRAGPAAAAGAGSGSSRIYGGLAKLTNVTPLIDIISGTSAGGLNGTLLGGAIAWGSTLAPLRDLWLEVADFDQLLRPMTEPSPPSLLKGEDYFLANVKDVLGNLKAHPTLPPAPDDPGLHVVATTTLINPSVESFEDTLGGQFSDPNHLGLFHFQRTKERGAASGQEVAQPERDDFARADAVGLMGRAARSSASYPIAFEPSYVAVEDFDRPGGDERIVDFEDSRFTLDGGLMDNEPIPQVLTLIADQPAPVQETHRVVVFVSPLAAVIADGPADDPTKVPQPASVMKDTILVPREQTIVAALQAMRVRSEQHKTVQAARQELFGGGALTGAGTATLADAAGILRPALDRLRDADPTDKLPGPTLTEARQARQNLLTVQDWLRRALAAGVAANLLGPRRLAVSEALPGVALAGGVTAATGVCGAAMASLCSACGIAVGPAGRAPGVVPAPPIDPETAALLDELESAAALATYHAGATATPSPAQWYAALTDIDTLQAVASDGRTHNPQQIDLLVLSAAMASPVWTTPVEKKLTGVQLAHFGAFYLRSWRNNDWIWGRLDSSARLVELLADPERLVSVNGVGPAVAGLAALLESATDDERDAFSALASAALSAVEGAPPGSDARTEAAAAARTLVAEAVAKELSFQILREELAGLSASLSADLARGASMTGSAGLVDRINTAMANPTPSGLSAVWGNCTIGEARITQELGSEHFAELSTRAAAVASNLLAGSVEGAADVPVIGGAAGPVGRVLSQLSRLFRAIHALSSPAAETPIARWAIRAVTVAAAVGLVLWAAGYASWIGVVSAVWVLAVLVARVLRHSILGPVVGVVLVVAGSVAVLVNAHLTSPSPLPYIIGTVVAIIGALIL